MKITTKKSISSFKDDNEAEKKIDLYQDKPKLVISLWNGTTGSDTTALGNKVDLQSAKLTLGNYMVMKSNAELS